VVKLINIPQTLQAFPDEIFILSDIDVFFFPHGRETLLHQIKALVTSDNDFQYGNAGFLIMRATPRMIGLTQRIAQEIRVRPRKGLHDQVRILFFFFFFY
jgi:hypothetical protein